MAATLAILLVAVLGFAVNRVPPVIVALAVALGGDGRADAR